MALLASSLEAALLCPAPKFGCADFAALSKISHVWRENANAMFLELANDGHPGGGPRAAMDHGRSMCPRCIAGRWQSCYATEAKLVGAGRTLMQSVLEAVVRKRTTKSGSDVLPIANAGALDPTTESTAQHRERMGRWRKDVVAAIAESKWWHALWIHHRVGGVVDHFMNFLGASYSDEKLTSEGNQLCQLVNGRAKSFFDKFDKMLQSPSLFRIEECGDVDDQSSLCGLAVLLTGHCAASFKRRIIDTIVVWPLKFVLFAVSPFNKKCTVRQGYRRNFQIQ